jgi:hypothetical protein
LAAETNPIREMKEAMFSENKAFNIVKWSGDGEDIETVCYATTKEQFQKFITTYPHKSFERISYNPNTREFMYRIG